MQVAALPGGTINHHWTKSLIASADGQKLYVGVGSNSNAAENGLQAESERARGSAMDKRGALLVADDVGDVVWRVSAANAALH
jgi:glucose/arabinose dehydrogenase